MKQTFVFLKELEKNNNREWFQANKDLYEASHQEMLNLAERVIWEMNQHDNIETASAKRSLYRIYRDVRFGKDKTPYKTNWAARLKRATAALRGGYYYQIQPGRSFVIGGFFGPNAEDLLHIRRHIDQDSQPLREIIANSRFKKYFGELKGDRLKTSPKGFERDHPDIDLLQLKQFKLRHELSDQEVLHKDIHLTITRAFLEMRPFFDFMSEILTTDLNGRSLLDS